MTKRETPRDGDGEKLCAWCGGQIRQSGIGRSKDYCSRTHREYAYRARREAEIKLVAYSRGRADERSISSTDDRGHSRGSSVDEMGSAGRAPVPAQAADPAPGGDFLLAPPAASPQESPDPLPDAWRAEAPAPRRKLSRNRSAMSAEAMPLWPEQEFRPEGANGE